MNTTPKITDTMLPAVLESLPLLGHDAVTERGGLIGPVPAVPEAWLYRQALSGIYRPVQTVEEADWLAAAAAAEGVPIACLTTLQRAKLVCVLNSERFFSMPRYERMRYSAAVVAVAACRYFIGTRAEAVSRGVIAPAVLEPEPGTDQDVAESHTLYVWGLWQYRRSGRFIVTSYSFPVNELELE